MSDRDAYETLCRVQDNLYRQIEYTCDDLDRVVENRGAHDEEAVQRDVRRLQAHLAALHAQLEGIDHALQRDHADDLAYDREVAREREWEARTLGTWDG